MRPGSVKILESETGSGKTEAALGYFFEMARAGQVRRLFFGLPTRTSAVQLHRRVTEAVKKRFPSSKAPVVLAVPGYARIGHEDGKLADWRVLWDDERLTVQGWLVENSKRYLAAPVAVGTVDQLLLSVLDSKHGTLRWAAAANSLLVVDEVHASDPYMAALLEEVVRRHVDRGGHVLLMSATLGSVLARRCLSAASPHPVPALPSLDEAVRVPYPMIRTARPGMAMVEEGFPQPDKQKQVRLLPTMAMNDHDAVARLAADHVRAGAKVLVIRNTVSACNAVHRRLERLLEPGQMMQVPNGRNAPHHGRFAPEDRRALDRAVEATFGKGSPSRGVALCATQTVEQSLDIDADILITDICPMDVLLQRIGRLHRHLVIDGKPKARPDGYDVALAVILEPPHPIADYADRPGNGIGLERAYSDVRTVCATQLLIHERKLIQIPRDNRELVERSTHPDALAAVEMQDERLQRHGREVTGKAFADRDFAFFNLRDSSWRYGDLPRSAADVGKIATRLGLKDSTISVPDGLLSPLGEFFSHVTIPSWQSPRRGISEDSIGSLETNPDGSYSFLVDGEPYVYGRCGLEKGTYDDVESLG